MNKNDEIKWYKDYLRDVVSYYIERASKYGVIYYYEFLESIEEANTVEELEMLSQITDDWLDY
jgi:hypothetical protein